MTASSQYPYNINNMVDPSNQSVHNNIKHTYHNITTTFHNCRHSPQMGEWGTISMTLQFFNVLNLDHSSLHQVYKDIAITVLHLSAWLYHSPPIQVPLKL